MAVVAAVAVVAQHQVRSLGHFLRPPLVVRCGFDVGLALELSEPENRDLCLTNKVFTYMLAGNAMILSETSMQRSFKQQYQVGESFAQNDVEKLMNCIKMYKDPGLLLKQRKHNYTLARESMIAAMLE